MVVVVLVKPLGIYMERVFERKGTWLDWLLLPAERGIHRCLGLDARSEMNWAGYTIAFVIFSAGNIGVLYLLLRCQGCLPWFYPQVMNTPMTPDLAANTAISFVTTTTWQAYAGENTMSYFSQLLLAGQNFLAGAAGLAVGVAFIRGYARDNTSDLGNFWIDLIRALLWVLIPASFIGSLLLIEQGVPMNFLPYTVVHTIAGGTQTIAQGPVAAMEFIKNLGTNGGGFFNANGAHPFENPTPLTNFVELLAIAVLPAAFTHTFGRMVGKPRDGWVIFWTMTALFVAGLALCEWAEVRVPPHFAHEIVGGNMEGKEVRFDAGASTLAAVVTSNGATGSYNSMHDSYQPLAGAVPLVNMLLGEIVYGGLGTGLYSMIFVALVALFLGGLMVGRTPKHLGRKLGPAEMKLIAFYTLLGPATVLILTAVAVATPAGRAGLTVNSGPHGFTEIFFAYASALANNGQSMASLNANSIFYNVTTIVAMLVGRFGLAALALAFAGRIAEAPRRTADAGTFPTDGVLFGVLLVATSLLVGALNFVPALALGPILEHFSVR